MKEQDWEELQRLWTSAPEHAEPVRRELERMRRARPWSAAGALAEGVVAFAGLAFGVWLIARGDALGRAVGSITILYTLVIGALSLRARRVAPVRLDDPVARAVAESARHARRSVQVAAAMIWAMSVAMAFVAAVAIARGFLGQAATSAGYAMVGAANLVLAVWLALAFRHYRKRSADLAQLEGIAASVEAG